MKQKGTRKTRSGVTARRLARTALFAAARSAGGAAGAAAIAALSWLVQHR